MSDNSTAWHIPYGALLAASKQTSVISSINTKKCGSKSHVFFCSVKQYYHIYNVVIPHVSLLCLHTTVYFLGFHLPWHCSTSLLPTWVVVGPNAARRPEEHHSAPATPFPYLKRCGYPFLGWIHQFSNINTEAPLLLEESVQLCVMDLSFNGCR